MTLPPQNEGFDHHPRTRLVLGPGCTDRAGELARELGGTRVLLVTDQGLVAAGHARHLEANLSAAGLTVFTYPHVHENPTTDDVDAAVAFARPLGIDLIVGLGGGSSLDTAKGTNFLLTNGGRMHDYWGIGKATRPMLPLIAIPTTAGTGSECQSFAVIADAVTHQKMACGDPKAAARVALLDPTVTLTQPRAVTASTGVDAIAHALETTVTARRTAWSAVWSREAARLTLSAFPRVLADGADLRARADMQLGAALAGLAIEASMLGAAHAAANPLTARFGVVHGQAVGLMLPHVIRFNAEDATAAGRYAEVAVLAGLAGPRLAPRRAADRLARHVAGLLAQAGLARRLRDLDVPAAAIEALAASAAEQWTGRFNPRPVTAPDFVQLYRAAR